MARIAKWVLLVAAIALVFSLVGCAAGTGRFHEESKAGFWAGLWHGLICVVTFIIGLFHESVRMYEPMNRGNLYDLGFLLGILIVFGGGGCSRRKRRCI